VILVVLCCLWVLCATAVALLPMRYQYVPGFVLLLAAPGLLIWVMIEAGPIWGLFAMLAFVSMFRRPLRFLAMQARDRIRGRTP